MCQYVVLCCWFLTTNYQQKYSAAVHYAHYLKMAASTANFGQILKDIVVMSVFPAIYKYINK
jgi:hypothetical protein